jgi:hypothetical protein
MRRHLIVSPSAQDVMPQLVALLLTPSVGALINRNDELRRFLQEFVKALRAICALGLMHIHHEQCVLHAKRLRHEAVVQKHFLVLCRKYSPVMVSLAGQSKLL